MSLSFANSPLSTSPPIRSHRIGRKYSCRGNQRNDRKSVVIPINCEKPTFDSASSGSTIPSFYSRNHHAGPYRRASGCVTNIHPSTIDLGEVGVPFTEGIQKSCEIAHFRATGFLKFS